MTDTTGITGRDNYIIAKALHLAIKWIDAMPKEYKALSDQEDMRLILNQGYPSLADNFQFQDELGEAMRRGFEVEVGVSITHEDIRAFLDSLPDTEGSA